MPQRPVSLHAPKGSVAAATIKEGLDALIAKAQQDSELSVEFPPGVLAEAEEAAASWRDRARDHEDLTAVAFVTLDPESSTDLDQAMHLERTGAGYRVHYAIADVPLFVPLGSALDAEARRRGATVYLPDRRIPLHPPVISEGAASLLPDQEAPAFVWILDLDAKGEVTAVDLRRAIVRSREKLDYDGVQAQIDAGDPHPMMALLQEIDDLRAALEVERGGASLTVPEQEVEADGEHVRLRWRELHPIEDANAQISLMTGMAAATIMLEGGAGVLRTMPPADATNIARFRRQAEVLGIPWADGLTYGAFLRTLDWRDPAHLALLNQAASLFRGASYAAFTTPEEIPEDHEQAALAAPYAHTTAPLRRLVDRFVLLACLAHVRGEQLPADLREALPLLPELMRESAARGGALERDAVSLVETAALEALVGETFSAAVIERREGKTPTGKDGKKNGTPSQTRVEVQLTDPPVTAWIPIDAEVGTVIQVHLDSVDIPGRTARFSAA